MTTKKKGQQESCTPSFSDELLALQELVRGLETDELSLEDSLKHYQSGVSIVSRAKRLLEKAEQEVCVLENSMKPTTQGGEEDEQFQ